MMQLAASPRFVCRYPFAPGDLVIFDNRRILHGRDRFTPQTGTRRLQGCYLDTDELLSRLRVLHRNGRA
ncbi:MAG: TauD/TfdA family dioxygenase, partial [Pseudomonadota bacterium]